AKVTAKTTTATTRIRMRICNFITATWFERKHREGGGCRPNERRRPHCNRRSGGVKPATRRGQAGQNGTQAHGQLPPKVRNASRWRWLLRRTGPEGSSLVVFPEPHASCVWTPDHHTQAACGYRCAVTLRQKKLPYVAKSAARVHNAVDSLLQTW